MCLLRFLCYARHADRNNQSLCEVCRRQQGAGNVAFFYGICPRGRTRGCEWRRERGSLHPLQMGAGVRRLLQKRQLLILLEDWAVGLLCGKGEQQSHPMYVLPVDSSLNKSLSIHRALCPLSNYPAHTCTSLRLRQHVSIKVLCEVPATPDGQIPHKMGDVNPNTPISITL
jgi:hypothetical protein